jgi:hypothetical protein
MFEWCATTVHCFCPLKNHLRIEVTQQFGMTSCSGAKFQTCNYSQKCLPNMEVCVCVMMLVCTSFVPGTCIIICSSQRKNTGKLKARWRVSGRRGWTKMLFFLIAAKWWCPLDMASTYKLAHVNCNGVHHSLMSLAVGQAMGHKPIRCVVT